MNSPSSPARTERTRVRRIPDRGHYDGAVVRAILDAGWICHMGFVDAGGFPVVIPTSYGRREDILYLHGSAASRMLTRLREGVEVCCTVMHLDGLVLARSVFHHSMNYRSVVVFGRARALEQDEEKLQALEMIANQIAPGRWEAARRPSAQELKATLVLALPLAEASAKIRTGPPKDEPEDYDLPVWAGVVPLQQTYGKPEPDPLLRSGILMPQPLLRGRIT
ncbi:MAG: pyridoxamine 5'-phosphate oxidase family protein [Terriglobales bacterium]